VTDDWNPNDPDATQVQYDLSAWTFEQMAELAAELADAAVPHSWDGNELIVPESAEEETDDIIARVEMRMGIASSAETEIVREPVPLPDDAPSTEYDLAEWEDDERELVTKSLVDRGLPFRWEEDVLLVGTDDEELVESILDEVENDEGVDLEEGDDDDDGEEPDADRLPFETLTTFFLAGDRLQKNPLDADGLEQLLSATAVADPERPPYGVDRRLWQRMCELADELAAALVDGDEPDVVETQAVASELHDLLRPYV